MMLTQIPYISHHNSDVDFTFTDTMGSLSKLTDSYGDFSYTQMWLMLLSEAGSLRILFPLPYWQ